MILEKEKGCGGELGEEDFGFERMIMMIAVEFECINRTCLRLSWSVNLRWIAYASVPRSATVVNVVKDSYSHGCAFYLASSNDGDR